MGCECPEVIWRLRWKKMRGLNWPVVVVNIPSGDKPYVAGFSNGGFTTHMVWMDYASLVSYSPKMLVSFIHNFTSKKL